MPDPHVLPALLRLIVVFQKVNACRTNETGFFTLCWDATSERFLTSVKAYSQRPAVKLLGKARETGTSLPAKLQGRGWLLGSRIPPITCPALGGRGTARSVCGNPGGSRGEGKRR